MMFGLLITVFTSLALGLVAGFVMHRSDFCMAGMFRDLFLFHSTFMLRMLVLFVAVCMTMLELARQLGCISVFPYPGFGVPALTTIAGGTLFGVGMVLAGGCVAGSLYKMGAGNVVSLTAFIGLIVGSTFYAEFHSDWAALAVKTRFSAGFESVAGIFGQTQDMVMMISVLALALPIYLWQRSGGLVRRSHARGYLQPWKASVVLALLVVISVAVLGVPLGITTGYSKIGAWLQSLVAPGHAGGLGYFKTTTFTYANQLLGIFYCGGPGPALDSISFIQFPLIFGLISGGFLSSLMVGEFKIYAAVPCRQLISGFAGGVLMGMAARMAPSCNIWHLLGGLPILAIQSLLFVAGLFPGAWLGCRLLTGLVFRGTQ